MPDVPVVFVYAAIVQRLRTLPRRPYEVGGWLLGWWAEDDASAFITHATPPGPPGTPCGVRISGRGHHERFDAAWAASGGNVTFLGDWHTHPGGPALPSNRDREALRQLAENSRFGTATPLAIIAGVGRWPWSAAVQDPALAILVRHQGEVTAPDVVVVDDMPEAARSVPDWPWPSRR